MKYKILFVCPLFLMALAGCSEGYEKSGGQWVWYDDWNQGSGDRPMFYLDDAEGELTELEDARYAKTADEVYYRGAKLYEADPASFELLEYPFSRDKHKVYCGTMSLVDADPDHFKILHNDKHIGTHSQKHVFKEVYGDHPALDENGRAIIKSTWSKDDQHIYHGYGIVKGADVNTFKPLTATYGKDENNVYYETHLIDGADTATFEASSNHAAEDKNTRFNDGEPVGPPRIKD
ncbi:hypothetical protein Pla110_41090 [Polystyrenella longa]|uniref:DKNYY family protein n=1 Tax=Polystyrenella longa TaxID=2528007 RepID=A0A518CT49_9PLAN|nr:DKNYY domain-containing protein [Polystyrenella longa]QDU82354.1 hypothetical protein Pla110_41090 [Polystyrenella longa]